MIINIVRKPYVGSTMDNVCRVSCGAINIEGTRVGDADTRSLSSLTALGQTSGWKKMHNPKRVLAGSANGRFPSNIILSDKTDTVLNKQSDDDVSRFFKVTK